MKLKNTLLSFEKDIQNRSFLDWLKAHTSFLKPLHRYKGVLILDKESFIFAGRDVKKDKDFNLEVSINEIIDIYLGFDDIFTGWEDRAYPWNKPLKIVYNNKKQEVIYVFANFHYKWWGMRTSDNKKVFNKIKELINKEND